MRQAKKYYTDCMIALLQALPKAKSDDVAQLTVAKEVAYEIPVKHLITVYCLFVALVL